MTAGQPDDSAAVRVVYANPTTIDAATRVRLQVLQTLVNNRLFLSIREELGATYGGFVVLSPETEPDQQVLTVFEADVDPERSDEVLDVVEADIADLVANGPTAEEFERPSPSPGPTTSWSATPSSWPCC